MLCIAKEPWKRGVFEGQWVIIIEAAFLGALNSPPPYQD